MHTREVLLVPSCDETESTQELSHMSIQGAKTLSLRLMRLQIQNASGMLNTAVGISG